MPTFQSADHFARTVADLEHDFDRSERRRITLEQAKQAQKIARRSAAADLGGDPKFSGWRPRLATQVRSVRNGATLLTPTKQSAGPWTVAEHGRNRGNGGGGAFMGPGINRRTGMTARTKSGGLRRVRSVRSRRWNGYTEPKFTASDAVAEMDRKLPAVADDGVRRVLKQRFDVS